jgi:hypothetical protein
MCLFREFENIPLEGPFGSLQTGDASEPVVHFEGYRELSPADRRDIDQVWMGRRPECLVYDPLSHQLLLFQHMRAGQPRSGRYYGYTIRPIALAELELPESPGWWETVFLCGSALLLTAAVFAGGWWAGLLYQTFPRPGV